MTRPRRPSTVQLTRVSDRWTFLYLDNCSIRVINNTIVAANDTTTSPIPASQLTALFLGPATSITHQAATELAHTGTTITWVANDTLTYLTHATPLAENSRLLTAQTYTVTNNQRRLAAARTMYTTRFPNENVHTLTMQQLRGREGTRVQRLYRHHADRVGLPWHARNPRLRNQDTHDLVNHALTTANNILYGLIHSVITAIGCSPALGIIHTGHSRSFVFDIADLYKHETTIPAAFDIARANPENIDQYTRTEIRARLQTANILPRTVRDIERILQPTTTQFDTPEILHLWDPVSTVPSGPNYGQ